VPPPGIPGPFALESSIRLSEILSGAGLADVSTSELPVPLRADSFEEWWSRSSALAGPVRKILASLPEAAVERIRARAREGMSGYQVSGGLEIPGVSLVASAHRT
jgi:hypothetical protein